MYHLHIGIDPRALLAARRALHPTHKLILDGDGWNAWGEAIGTDRNDGRTLHGIVTVERKGHARLLLAGLVEQQIYLTPMMRQSTPGMPLAVLTDVNDWGCLDGVEGTPRTWLTICKTCGRTTCGRNHRGQCQ